MDRDFVSSIDYYQRLFNKVEREKRRLKEYFNNKKPKRKL